MPRLKDLKEQQLYQLDRATSYGELNNLFAAPSTSPSSANSGPACPGPTSLNMFGRIVKTVYVLQYLHR